MADDPYLLPNGTLRNRLGITDPDDLSRREADLTRDRLFDIETKGPAGPFDFDRLKATHRFIFQDVYAWAGEPRAINLFKREYDGGPLVAFTPREEIEPRGARIFAALAQADQLRGLDRESFAGQAADLFAGINALHPFREGNGRTQRAFIEALAREAGRELDSRVVSKERMVEASIQATKGTSDMMRRMFGEISDPSRTRPLAEAVQFLAGIKEIGGARFDWNEHYIATTTPGQRYGGLLVGQQGENFLMRQGGELFVGWSDDLPKDARRGAAVNFTATDHGLDQAQARSVVGGRATTEPAGVHEKDATARPSGAPPAATPLDDDRHGLREAQRELSADGRLMLAALSEKIDRQMHRLDAEAKAEVKAFAATELLKKERVEGPTVLSAEQKRAATAPVPPAAAHRIEPDAPRRDRKR